jgi:hypothetical protein
MITHAGSGSYLADSCNNRGAEQGFWRRLIPIFVCWCKVDIGQVSSDTGHSNGAVTQLVAKVKFERVVLDVLVSCIVLQTSCQYL